MTTYEEFYMGEFNRVSTENADLKDALRRIESHVEPDNWGGWDDMPGRLEHVMDITTDLRKKGLL